MQRLRPLRAGLPVRVIERRDGSSGNDAVGPAHKCTLCTTGSRRPGACLRRGAPDDGVAGTGTVFLLLDEPEVSSRPATRATRWCPNGNDSTSAPRAHDPA